MSEILLWFVAFCVILGAEMLLSTVYLLALATAALMASLSCLLGDSTVAHITVAALVTVLGIALVYTLKKRHLEKADNKTQYPDEGRTISVGKVVDGVARVTYRGASWDAVADHEELTAGIWEIKKVDGTRLILKSIDNVTKIDDK